MILRTESLLKCIFVLRTVSLLNSFTQTNSYAHVVYVMNSCTFATPSTRDTLDGLTHKDHVQGVGVVM